MTRYRNLLLMLAVIALTALPLLIVERSADGEIFAGADDKAKDMIGTIAPDYEPWFSSLIEPASGEISSLLFALQAALGAGFIGYYLGVGVTREKLRREKMRQDDAHPPLAASEVPIDAR